MIILAIDTSCDETSVAVCHDLRVLSNVVSSQVRYHRKFGGVVPFLAGRLHTERIDAVVELALQRAKLGWDSIEAIAVTYGPGLAPALQVGVETAKNLSAQRGLPLYAVNHMLGHIASVLVQNGATPRPPLAFPALAVLVSGGHSELVRIDHGLNCSILGQTLDDALGEAYDKVAKMLGLGYPGGALLSRIAATGNPTRYELPVPMLRSKDLNLSYSGLKNAVRLLIIEVQAEAPGLTAEQVADIAAAFERVAQRSLLNKVTAALAQHPECQSLILGGGVAANTRLRAQLRSLAKVSNHIFHLPATRKLCTDNAAMIAVAAYLGIMHGQLPADPSHLERVPNLGYASAEIN